MVWLELFYLFIYSNCFPFILIKFITQAMKEKEGREMEQIATSTKLMLVFAVLGLVSLQQLSILRSRFNWSNDIETFALFLCNIS